jgi:dihydroxyacetone kinase
VRKLLNDPFAVVDEMVDGLAAMFPEHLSLTASRRGIVARLPASARRTSIVTGGGSGHEPAFFGYVGPGLADGAALGNVFASPPATHIAEVARAVDRGTGVLFVYGNYDGDVMNFELASELLEDDGVASLHAVVSDDVASAPGGRGVAGNVFVLKAAGARADEGGSLTDVRDTALRMNDRTRTIGVGLGPCTVPAAGRPTFELADGEMDVGMGIHGEAGLERRPLASADAVADELLDLLLEALQPAAGEHVAVLVNSFGATPAMEGYVVVRRVLAGLRDRGLPTHRARVGEYVTSLEMAGLSVTLAALDADLRALIDAPASPLAAPTLAPPW